MRLGELLVAVGDVTPQQVEEALRRQILHGGRIGSNLIELGFLSMDQLAHALGRQHQRPPVLEVHYRQIDQALAVQVSPQLAATWHAVPLGRTGDMASRIAIATTDPLAPEALEGLKKIFKTEIVQAIAPELRLFYWLEQVYGIQRINRFKRIHTREPSNEGAESEVSSERRAYVHTISDSEEIVDTSPLARIAVKRIAIPRTTDVEIPTDPNNSEQFVRSIRRATSGTSMADLVCHLLQYGFSEVFSAGMLMVARDRVLVGWKGFVRDAPDKSIDALAVPLDSPSMLHGPSANRDSFFGFPEPASIDERLWHYLGPPPREIAVLPIEIDDKLACVLYVQSNAPIPADYAGTLGEVSRSISACLTRLIRNAKR